MVVKVAVVLVSPRRQGVCQVWLSHLYTVNRLHLQVPRVFVFVFQPTRRLLAPLRGHGTMESNYPESNSHKQQRLCRACKAGRSINPLSAGHNQLQHKACAITGIPGARVVQLLLLYALVVPVKPVKSTSTSTLSSPPITHTLPAQLMRCFICPQRPSGQAVVTGIFPNPSRRFPSILLCTGFRNPTTTRRFFFDFCGLTLSRVQSGMYSRSARNGKKMHTSGAADRYPSPIYICLSWWIDPR